MEQTVVRRRERPLRTLSSSGKALGSKTASPRMAARTAQSWEPSVERADQLTARRRGLTTAYDITCGREYSAELERAQSPLKRPKTKQSQKSRARTSVATTIWAVRREAMTCSFVSRGSSSTKSS